MPGPSQRKREPTKHPLSPLPDPEEGVNPRLPDAPAEAHRTGEERGKTEHVETEAEQQARESEKAFDQAATRIPPE